MTSRFVIHEADPGGFRAEFPMHPGCHTEGETIEEVLTRAPDAGGSHLDAHAERGADAAHAVPGAPDARGSHVDVLRADDQEVPASTEGAAITTIDLPAAV